MRKLTFAAALAAGSVATPALAADLNVSIEIPRLSVAAYHRPYVAVWIERPDNTAVRTLAVWYEDSNTAEGKDWLKDMRTWWRRGGRALTLPADGISSATKAPGRHTVAIPGARLSSRRLRHPRRGGPRAGRPRGRPRALPLGRPQHRPRLGLQ